MKTTIALFLACSILFLDKTTACSCAEVLNFCQTITYGNNGEINDGLNICRVKVASIETNGINVDISGMYHGDTNLEGQTIFIENGNGADCGHFVSGMFAVDDKLIVVLSGGVNGGWQISICGVTFLTIENGVVSGPIAPRGHGGTA